MFRKHRKTKYKDTVIYMQKIFVSDFSGEGEVSPISAALEKAKKAGGECEIFFGGETRILDYTEAEKCDIHVSNTHAEGNCREKELSDSITRNTPFFLDGLRDVTVNGNGSVLKLNGKMTVAILKNCQNITFKNITFDYTVPVITEMTVVGEGNGYIDCRVARDSLYRITDGNVEWYGANFAFKTGISQIFRPKTGFTWRYPSPMQDKNARFEEIEKGLLRIHFSKNADGANPYGVILGDVFQMRDPIREECGFILDRCENTRFENVTVHMMDGLGFIAQNCNGITLDRFSAYPACGRTAACSADFMHFSGCRGKIKIVNGTFIGAHDDAINVHGTHLKIADVNRAENKIKVRFMHPQTFGIGGFEIGDEITAVNPETLIGGSVAKVTACEEVNARELVLTLDRVGEDFVPDMMVENISATAEVEVKNNYFARIPTRGILVTTRKKVVIEENTFEYIKGSGVLIADDARSWYESGPVSDVTVRRNTYRACSGKFVDIHPECVEESKQAVHRNIKITENLIEISDGNTALYAKNTDGLTFKNNVIIGSDKTEFINVYNLETD